MTCTPGPWGWVSVPGATTVGIHGPTGPIESIATVHDRDSDCGNVTLANARLIAAAPEMYEALYGLQGLLADVEAEPEVDAEILRAIHTARSAIGKAEGRDQ